MGILKRKTLQRGNSEIKIVEMMMSELYPVEERSSIDELLKIASSVDGKLDVYYFSNKIIGFSFVINKSNFTFIYYLGVNKDYQSRGFGSKIINLIKKENNDNILILNIEALNKESLNYEERIRRFKFYRKNGFQSTNYYLQHEGVVYEIIASDVEFDISKYKSLLESLSSEYIESIIFKN